MSIQTVTELNQSIKLLIENNFPFVSVIGEISNLRRPYSGHLYFSLKDSTSTLRAVLFKMQQRYLSCSVDEGAKVICYGRLSVYEPRGEYQIIVDRLEPQGEGALQLAFEALKKKLAAEGLFKVENKKNLPLLPQRVVLVTSLSGAALHDFLVRAQSRCPGVPIDIFPVAVQGDDAAAQIERALHTLSDYDAADVVVLCRGGGSIEDLWCFNNESLTRTVAAFPFPIVTAIGHEIDSTLVDFAADVRAATPTAAAEIVLPEREILELQITQNCSRMVRSVVRMIATYRSQLTGLRRLLVSPQKGLEQNRIRLDYTTAVLIQEMKQRMNQQRTAVEILRSHLLHFNPEGVLEQHKEHLQGLIVRLIRALHNGLQTRRERLVKGREMLTAVSPHSILERGYCLAYTTSTGALLRSAQQVHKGDLITLQLQRGGITAQVTTLLDD